MSHKPYIFMFLRTSSLLHDERVLKEAETISSLDCGITINVSENINTQKLFKVKSANVRSSKLFTFNLLGKLSVVELVLRSLPQLISAKRKDDKSVIVWLHDPIMFCVMPFVLILRKMKFVDRIVWDHHELPPQNFIDSKFWAGVFSYFLKKVDINIQANQWRVEYAAQKYLAGYSEKTCFEVLRNYPLCQQQPLSSDIKTQKPSGPFIYIQSGFGEHRNYSSLKAALKLSASLPIVFSGPTSGNIDFADFPVEVILLGKITPDELQWYFQNAAFTVILYRSDFGINNHLCEPNRLFHAVHNQLPAIVGNNPAMLDAVQQYKCGKVLPDDGQDIIALGAAIKDFCFNYSSYTYVTPPNAHWQAQKSVIGRVLYFPEDV